MEEPREIATAEKPDPERTLLQPRFDVSEARTAQPVVPLQEVRARSWRRGALPAVLLLASALFGGVVSIFAYRLYQQQHRQAQAAQPAPAPPQPTPAPELPAAAPVETVAPVETARAEQPTAEHRTATAEKHEITEEARATPAEEARTRVSETKEKETARRGEEARATPERAPRARRIEVLSAEPERARVRRVERHDGGEATDYEVPADVRERPRPRRPKSRNVDRIRDIFEGPPPADH